MKVTYKFKKPVRAIEQTIDTKAYDGFTFPDNTEWPIYYVVKVQVKVCSIWFTIWEQQCDVSDGDTRQHIYNEANQLLKIMEG